MIDEGKFSDKKELFAYLVANKSALIALKKSATKKTDCLTIDTDSQLVIKSATTSNQDDLEAGIIKRTIVGNTYGWMDSHSDVHIKGIFSKSISENKNILHLHDHLQMITAKVGTPVQVYEGEINWTDLGVVKQGKTTALFMDSDIKKSYNALVFEEYLNKQINQHSVGMQYVNLFLCVNDAEYKEEFAKWNAYISQVANSDKAHDKGYFWAVTEAKLIEISCVISGSNELTPTLENKITQEVEPVIATQKEEPIIKGVDYNYLLTKI